MTACIVGWAHSRFGKLEGEDIETLVVKAGSEAIVALLGLVRDSQSESVKLAAIKELLDRGFGRAAAAPSESGGGITAHLLVDDGYAH